MSRLPEETSQFKRDKKRIKRSGRHDWERMREVVTTGNMGPMLASTVLLAIDIAAFQPVAQFKAQAAAVVAALKATPCAPGVEEILLPGELEWRTKAQRAQAGIPLPAVTWRRIQEAAKLFQ